MAIGLDDVDSRIRDLAEREKECDSLFDEIRNGNGKNSVRYLALRDSCNELRKELFRSAKSLGLTRERIKSEIEKARNQTTIRR